MSEKNPAQAEINSDKPVDYERNPAYLLKNTFGEESEFNTLLNDYTLHKYHGDTSGDFAELMQAEGHNPNDHKLEAREFTTILAKKYAPRLADAVVSGKIPKLYNKVGELTSAGELARAFVLSTDLDSEKLDADEIEARERNRAILSDALSAGYVGNEDGLAETAANAEKPFREKQRAQHTDLKWKRLDFRDGKTTRAVDYGDSASEGPLFPYTTKEERRFAKLASKASAKVIRRNK